MADQFLVAMLLTYSESHPGKHKHMKYLFFNIHLFKPSTW